MTIIPPYPSEVTSKPKTKSIPILSKIPWIAVALAQCSFRIARCLQIDDQSILDFHSDNNLSAEDLSNNY
ncbi:hypothetical protein BpHYR1_000840 [Brachionus plicatilis]|uniref:Uncharacterized protein n=1 Tax=Brachionus plicatilis TaxID=10195 RepID=A0A3M7RBX9_BRAPC|nr:hypothetical protein BpHYR1_000840 [Brachionus plicatilis]